MGENPPWPCWAKWAAFLKLCPWDLWCLMHTGGGACQCNTVPSHFLPSVLRFKKERIWPLSADCHLSSQWAQKEPKSCEINTEAEVRVKAWDEACPSPHLCVYVSVHVCVYMPLGLLCPDFPTKQPSGKNLRGKESLFLSFVTFPPTYCLHI